MFVLGVFIFVAPMVYAYTEVPRPWQTWGPHTGKLTLLSGFGMTAALIGAFGLVLGSCDRIKQKEAIGETEDWNGVLHSLVARGNEGD